MRRALAIVATLFGATIIIVATAQAQKGSKTAGSTSVQASSSKTANAEAARTAEFSVAEGEKRFRQNCGRCHVAPDKFPPRMMATIVRHMRVRATITDADMRLILWYMTR